MKHMNNNCKDIALSERVRITAQHLPVQEGKVMDYDPETKEYAVQVRTTYRRQTIWAPCHELEVLT